MRLALSKSRCRAAALIERGDKKVALVVARQLARGQLAAIVGEIILAAMVAQSLKRCGFTLFETHEGFELFTNFFHLCHITLLLFLDKAEKFIVLLLVEDEFENFTTIDINSDNIDIAFLRHLRLQFECRDEVLDHFEVHDAETEVDNIPRDLKD